MSAYKPQDGHRARLTVNGIYRTAGPDHWSLTDSEGLVAVSGHNDAVIFAERVPDPEPEWQQGDVVEINGFAFFRTTRFGWIGTSGIAIPDEQIRDEFRKGSVTPLIRDGKPWPQDGAP